MKITTYNDIRLKILRHTDKPAQLVTFAAEQTQVMYPKGLTDKAKLIEYLVEAEHHSPLEHVSATFLIEGCSRSFLAQITRQRTFKFTSASQHYQDYKDYPCVIHPGFTNDDAMRAALRYSYAAYDKLLKDGAAKEEARQVLPNAAAVNLVVTADARNLMYFFRQRRCERNVAEMKYVADAMWAMCVNWFPELFKLVGPPCVMNNRCTQGSMKAEVCGG